MTEAPLLPPQTVLQGRYRIGSMLARGGMSRVYAATLPDAPDREVAVKQMRVPGDAPDLRRRAVEQFRSEADLLARLRHPGLVEIVDFFSEKGDWFIVMPRIRGRDLEQVRRAGPAPLEQVLDWSRQLCDVLAYLHGQSPPVVFRDLTPRNMLVDVHGRLHLVDFGLARCLDQEDGTRTYVKGAGTPGYAPLEQSGAGTTDLRADIYALGAVMYALLTGETPPPAVARARDQAVLIPLAQARPDVPAALAALVDDCLRLYAARRPRDVQAVRARLDGTAPSADDAPTRPRGASRAPAPVAPTRWSLLATAGADRGARYDLAAPEIVLGRGDPLLATAGQLCFLESSVSRHQAVVRWDGAQQRWVLAHDPRATNPTRLNGQRVVEGTALEDGDRILMGRLQLDVAYRQVPAPLPELDAETVDG